jgi:DNA invertase Pin-like site-specific DNA recombinase
MRLIAVNNGIDTAKGEDDFTPFREIMSEWDARNTSRKIKSVLTNKGKDGKPLTNIPPYGYKKIAGRQKQVDNRRRSRRKYPQNV